MKSKNATQKIVMSALLAALACVATMVIKIPSPMKGYLNLGDCVVLTAGLMLPPTYGFLAAGLGSALADLISGYTVYAPVTFVIKGLMALIVYYGYKILSKKLNSTASFIISGTAAELIMVLGYFCFEGFMYGFVPSLVNVPANALQGVAGLVLSCVLIRILKKIKLPF